MFVTERNRQEGILAKPQKKLKQAARILMALVLGVSLWGQEEIGVARTSYYFDNPASGNKITVSENGYESDKTPLQRTGGYSSTNLDSYYGGDSYSQDASNNIVVINSGTLGFVVGGTSTSGNASNNTVTINNGTIGSSVIGGETQSHSAVASNNTIVINNGQIDTVRGGLGRTNTNGNIITINGGVVGDVIGATAISGTVSNNVININGGTVTGRIVLADGTNVESISNTLNIYNNPDLSNAFISGGANVSSASRPNSTLNIHSKGLSSRSIRGFGDVNFYLPASVVNGDTILTVSDYADLQGTNIRAGVEGNANLSTGDTITLIKNANGITTDSTTTYGTLSEGVSLDYELTVEKADDTSIVARVGSASSSPEGTSGSGDTGKFSSGGPNTSGGSGTSGTSALKTQTNVLPAPLLASTTLTLHGTDRLLDWLPPEDPVVGDDTSEEKDDSQENVAKAESPNEFQIFANTGFSNLRTKIGGNSYMDNHSAGFDLGAARTLENSRGRLVFAPIVDYGSGSYDVYNDGRHGSGNSKYWAAGMIARQMNKDGFYYEASFRAGRAMVDFASDDFTQGGVPTRVTYDASAPCFAGHVRVGKIYQFGPRNQLHLYGIYSHNHQNGMTATLSTGETYHFSAVDSGRLRIGGRLSWQKSKTQKFYSGIAYQYEFSNGATGSYKGYSTNSSSIHGSSAMIELGWQIKPSQKSPWMVDVNAAGWVGHQKGFTIQAKLMKSF